MPDTKEKISISNVLLSLFAICFLIYISLPVFQLGADIKAYGILILAIPFIIALIREIFKLKPISPWEQWVFIIIAMVLWIVQSMINGRLSRLF